MLRRLAITVLLAASATTGALAAGEPQFQPGPGLGSLDSGATGVYELGSVRFGKESGRLQALVHHGRVLQVHCRHEGRWLAKRSGSSGGKAIAPTKFDELSVIAGGLNQDIRQAPATVRDRFARAAGLVLLDSSTVAPKASTNVRTPGQPRFQVVSTANASTCGAIGCRVIHRHDTAGAERFVVTADSENSRWGFEGYGIVAIWPVPQAE
jgi:hypothetical protein